MKRIGTFLILCLVVFVGVVFAVLNAQPVLLNYYFGSREMPLSLVFILALIVGSVLGILASISLLIRSRREMQKLRKAAKLAEKEVTNLRSLPIRDAR